jgi:serine/threonine protein kinase
MLIIEWIDPADPAITFFNHLDWNQEFVQEPYTLEAFETALSQHFVRYELIGAVSPTRRLYAAYQTAHELDLSNPLPLIFSEETVISSRLLTKNDGIEYWSRVYEGQDVIHKQTSLDLAEREGHFLAQLSHEYFPNVLSTSSEANYSLVALEKIEGLPLLKAVPFINDTFTKFHQFIQHCLNLLEELKRHGLTHRDIHASNILIRNEKPVLIDFGWAISATQTYFTPPELNLVGRPPDGNSCDVYAMGKVFEQINQHRYPAFERVIELMTDPDASLRITDIDTLRILFASASAAADVVEMDKYARA